MIYKPYALFFGGIGLILLLVALGFAIPTTLFISQAQAAGGVVIEAAPPGSTYKAGALIRFTTSDGQEIQFNTTRVSPPEFRAGQEVKVYYDPADPAGSALADSFISMWFIPALLAFLGAVFGGIGVGCFIPWRLSVRKRKWLNRYGRRVTAVITGIRPNRGIRKNSRSPVIITAQWHDQYNVPHFFKSESFWEIPAVYSPGSPINVLIDPQNPRRYHIEVIPVPGPK